MHEGNRTEISTLGEFGLIKPDKTSDRQYKVSKQRNKIRYRR